MLNWSRCCALRNDPELALLQEHLKRWIGMLANGASREVLNRFFHVGHDWSMIGFDLPQDIATI
jgi:hypothetical protein